MKQDISDRFDYLEDERRKLWEAVDKLRQIPTTDIPEIKLQIATLQESVAKKTSDYENDAKLSSEKASTYETQIEQAAEETQSGLETVKQNLVEIKAILDSSNDCKTKLSELLNTASDISSNISNFATAIKTTETAAKTQGEAIEAVFNKTDTFNDKIKVFDENIAKGLDLAAKTEANYTAIGERRASIDALYYEIFGITQKDAAGNLVTTPAKKDTLENAYEALQKEIMRSKSEISTIESESKVAYLKFSSDSETAFNSAQTQREENYTAIVDKINSLLPNALTTGLSYAYSEKKTSEIEERKTYTRTFYWAIGILAAVSLIPLSFTVKEIFDQKSYTEIISQLPRLALGILPLYIPFLWLAYSASKKINLSKRLSEEYAHKEVLSKTFEGLATQISNIENKATSSQLRDKLLYNILEISSENPGKLISDYNKSDHPLMDALDKSVKLANAFQKLSKIPGFTKISKAVEKRAGDLLNQEDKKVGDGINSLDELEATS